MSEVEKQQAVEEVTAQFSAMLAGKKKKKKKKKKVVVEEVAGTEGGPAWANSDRDYTYIEILNRMFALLKERNPNLAAGRKKHRMPPPQTSRVGTRKTMWSNFAPICQLMHRTQEHVMSYVLAELGTDGSIDGNKRMVLKGRFTPKQIENLLKKYIGEYVTCHMCRTPETTLTRDPMSRLYFLECSSCGSKRSVAPISRGFHATNRSDRRAAKAAK